MKKVISKAVVVASNFLVCIAAFVAIAPCIIRGYEPPMPEKLRAQLMD